MKIACINITDFGYGLNQKRKRDPKHFCFQTDKFTRLKIEERNIKPT